MLTQPKSPISNFEFRISNFQTNPLPGLNALTIV